MSSLPPSWRGRRNCHFSLPSRPSSIRSFSSYIVSTREIQKISSLSRGSRWSSPQHCGGVFIWSWNWGSLKKVSLNEKRKYFFSKSTQVQIIICTCVLFEKKYFLFSFKLTFFKLPQFQLQIKTPPQCWGLDHRDPRERELIFWISLVDTM